METLDQNNLDAQKKAHNEDTVGRLIYKVFSTPEGEILLKTLKDSWVTVPASQRIQKQEDQSSDGTMWYELGRTDAYYRLKISYDNYVTRATQLGESLDD